MNFTGDLQNFHPKTSIIFNDVTHDAQICYHLVYPKNFELLKRPKRTIPASRDAGSNKRRRRGRPRKEDTIKSTETADTAHTEKSDEITLKMACSRTRSGRVSRPPKHMSKFVDMKDARTTAATATTTTTVVTTTVVTSAIEALPTVELNSSTGVPGGAATVNGHGGDGQQAPVPPKEPRKMRKNVDRFTCGVCKKVREVEKQFFFRRFRLLSNEKTFTFSLNSVLKSKKQIKNQHFLTFRRFTWAARSC